MTVTSIVDNVTKWAEEKICSKVELKLPVADNPRNREPIDYKVELVHPAAFALFVPGKDRLPPNIQAPVPSVCVQLVEGLDQIKDRKRILTLRLSLAAWNPGTQSDELFWPHKKEDLDIPWYFRKGEKGPFYNRNFDGWRDVFNFMDTTLRELEQAESIAGLSILKDDGIMYGPYTGEGAEWEYFPYWHSWVTFKIECGLVTAIPGSLKELL